jgi:putative hemolysin
VSGVLRGGWAWQFCIKINRRWIVILREHHLQLKQFIRKSNKQELGSCDVHAMFAFPLDCWDCYYLGWSCIESYRISRAHVTEGPGAHTIPNPAAYYCTELGTYETVAGEDGQQGVCRFPDGQTCDAWDLLRASAGRCATTAQVRDFPPR